MLPTLDPDSEAYRRLMEIFEMAPPEISVPSSGASPGVNELIKMLRASVEQMGPEFPEAPPASSGHDR